MVFNEKILDDKAKIMSIDASGMLSLIDDLPKMMEGSWQASQNSNIPDTSSVSNIVISGMGGSAISGDIVTALIREGSGLPVTVNRGYECPGYVNENTLFIAASYSGNTEETLSAVKKAINKKAVIISICSGGELKEISTKNNIPVIEVPKGLPPRAAIGHLLPSVLSVISKMKLSDDLKADFTDTLTLLKQLVRQYGVNNALRDNPVKQLAVKLGGKTPVIFATDGTTYPAGLRWKTQLNENSKITAILSIFPELDHNEIVNMSFLEPGKHDLSVIILRDEADIERMKKRIEITKSLISGYVGGITEIWSQGKNKLARTMSLILFGDYLSVYLAILSEIDPTPVDIIEKLKKELAR